VDVDNDGLLDLFICNYVQFGPDTDPQLCKGSTGELTSCGPREYQPEPSRLFRNRGGGRFEDVTRALGFDKLTGKALGVAAADYNASGWQSISVANDEMAGDLMRRVANGKFENIASAVGTAYDENGNVHGGMGTDWGDYDNDGRLDLFVGTFQRETKNLYRQEADGLFVDRAKMLGLAPALPYVTFGAKFLDFDNDGWLDLIIANGHVQDNIAQFERGATYRQPTQLFRNEAGQKYREVTAQMEEMARRPIVGRGLAIGDYDNDGWTDVLIVDSEGKPLLLQNTGFRGPGSRARDKSPSDSRPPAPGLDHWIGFRLIGTGRINRDGYGAVVTVEAGGRKMVRHCHADGSYLSSSDPRVRFGLGTADRIDKLSARWPNGRIETFPALPVDRYHTLVAGTGLASPSQRQTRRTAPRNGPTQRSRLPSGATD
jgi:hypothetical protein